MTWTDAVIFLLLLISAAIGVNHGFMRSISRPLILLFSSLLAYAIFYLSRNLIEGLAVAILGPILIPWIIKILLIEPEPSAPPPLSMLSRLAGAAVNLAWSGTVIVLVLLSLSMIPLKSLGMEMARKDISSSQSSQILSKFLNSKQTVAKTSDPSSEVKKSTVSCPEESCAEKQEALN